MEKIADVDEIQDALLITLEDKESGQEVEAVVVNGEQSYRCWLNYCKHITTVSIHKGGDAPVRGNEIVCQNHGAMFDLDTGVCTFGPCEGAVLDEVEIQIDSDKILLSDEDYRFVKKGGVESDDLDSSTTGEYSF